MKFVAVKAVVDPYVPLRLVKDRAVVEAYVAMRFGVEKARVEEAYGKTLVERVEVEVKKEAVTVPPSKKPEPITESL